MRRRVTAAGIARAEAVGTFPDVVLQGSHCPCLRSSLAEVRACSDLQAELLLGGVPVPFQSNHSGLVQRV